MAPTSPHIVQLTLPLLLGHLFNWGLYGCLVIQCYIYYLAFPNDRLLPKSLVYTALILETLQTVLSTHDAVRNFALEWGSPDDLDKIGWLWFTVPFLGSLITSLAQFFFAWRISLLSRKLYIPVLIAVLSSVQCVFGCWDGIRAQRIKLFSKAQILSRKQTAVWLGGTALCDFIIAISMIYYLYRSRTGFRSTNVLITKIIRITIETGLICAAFAVLGLAFFLRWKDNNYHLAPSIALSKLYSNSLLVVLNSRIRVIGGRGTSGVLSDGTDSRNNARIPKTTVNMLTITTQQVDEAICMADARNKGQLETDCESNKGGPLV